MNEYAISFYALCKQSFKIDAQEMLDAITVVSTPHLQESDRKNLIQSLEMQINDIIIDEVDADDYSGLQVLKQELA